MPLMLPRVGTIYSLTQLAAEASEPGCSLPAGAKGVLSTPDKAVRDIGAGASLLPLYSFPDADGFAAKRVRSFGSFVDLAGAGAVPDVDDGAGSAGAVAGASDDDSASLDGSSDSGQVGAGVVVGGGAAVPVGAPAK